MKSLFYRLKQNQLKYNELQILSMISTKLSNCFAKWRTEEDLPTCLAPRSKRGLWRVLFFHAINDSSICLLKYFLSSIFANFD